MINNEMEVILDDTIFIDPRTLTDEFKQFVQFLDDNVHDNTKLADDAGLCFVQQQQQVEDCSPRDVLQQPAYENYQEFGNVQDASGMCFQPGLQGNLLQAASPGNYSQPASPGHLLQAVSPGNYSQPASPGHLLQAVSPGNYSQPASPGNLQAVSPGNYSQSASPGNLLQAVSPDDYMQTVSPVELQAAAPLTLLQAAPGSYSQANPPSVVVQAAPEDEFSQVYGASPVIVIETSPPTSVCDPDYLAPVQVTPSNSTQDRYDVLCLPQDPQTPFNSASTSAGEEQQGVLLSSAQDSPAAAPKKRGRKPKYPDGAPPRRRRERKQKVYELEPLVDQEAERKRQNACKAKEHRDKIKAERKGMASELLAVTKERDDLLRQLHLLKLELAAANKRGAFTPM